MEVSDNELKNLVLAVSTEIEIGQLTAKRLAGLMTARYGGTDASGAWSWRMAYDVMEAGFIHFVLSQRPEDDPATESRRLIHLQGALPTQTRRSEAQLRLQQFSTPLAYAHLVSCAAGITHTDKMLEPSAGTGSMALFAHRAGAHLCLNEIDPFRARLLAVNFGNEPTSHNGEHIDDLLGEAKRPSVVMMNPPFSSSIKRAGDPTIAARHLVSTAKRLADGGRIVAIMPDGFLGTQQRLWFERFSKIVRPRMILKMPGAIYRKTGTSVNTVLVVADKIEGGDEVAPINVTSLDEALSRIENDLPERSKPCVSASEDRVVAPSPRLQVPPRRSTTTSHAKTASHSERPLNPT